jgi:hypothetical protein
MVALCYISKEKQNGCLVGVINSTQWLLRIDMKSVIRLSMFFNMKTINVKLWNILSFVRFWTISMIECYCSTNSY